MSAAKTLTPTQRSLRASLAADASWANCNDRSARARPGVEARLRKFEAQVDPDGVLDPPERRRRAEQARRSYMKSLALRRSRNATRKAS